MRIVELVPLVGQLFVYGPTGPTLDTSLCEVLDSRCAGGLILFARNCPSGEAVRELTRRAKARARLPLWVMIDQEGGRVRRLKEDAYALPSARELAALPDDELRERVARMARALRELGIDVDLAPVLDTDSNPKNPVIGDRAFSSDPDTVFAKASAYLAGLRDGGLLGCGKHFPGHGDTALDSHHALPFVAHERARLDAIELAPFRRAAEAGWPLLMAAHVVFPALDPDEPATLSPRIGRELLRTELGFRGLLLSDDVEMKAISERYPAHELARRLFMAGMDQILVCSSYAKLGAMHAALCDLIVSGEIPRATLDDALERIARAKAQAGVVAP